jgi:hypothetical protein
MRLRELTFPILIRYRNALEGGENAGLGRPTGRFNWAWAAAFEDGRFDDSEIIDAGGQAYRVEEIFFMGPTFWQWFLRRLGYLLVLPELRRSEVAPRVDMELEPTRNLTLEQFKTEFRALILAHPAWWKRVSSREEMEGIFSKAQSLADAIDEIGFLAPSDNMRYHGKSKKIVDMR